MPLVYYFQPNKPMPTSLYVALMLFRRDISGDMPTARSPAQCFLTLSMVVPVVNDISWEGVPYMIMI